MSKRKYPTASQLQRAFSCLYPWRSHVEWSENAPGYPARVGSAVHECIEHRLCDEDVNVQAVADRHGVSALDVSKLYDVWQAWWSQNDRKASLVIESAAGYDGSLGPQTYGQRIGRAYPDHSADAIVGTSDLVEYTDEGSTVTDWKTTLGIDSTAAPAADNEQLHALAWMASAGKVRLVIISEDGVRVDEAAARDDMAQAKRMAGLMLSVELDNAGPNPGSHCSYCPAAHGCPATSAAQAAIVGATQPTLDLSTGDGIYHARTYLKLVDAARERLDEAIKLAVVAAGGRVDLGNGRALKLSTRSRETIQWSDDEKANAKAEGRVKVSTYDVLTEGKA